MKNRLFLILITVIVILLIGVFVFFAFQNNSSKKEGTISIGLIAPLTGDTASIGESSLAAAEFAVAEINEHGGVLGRELRIIAEDDACSSKGTQAMNKLARIDKVTAISGPDCSASAGPSLPIAQNAHIPVVIRWASAPHLAQTGDYIFRVYPADSFQGAFAARYLFDTLKARKAAVLYVKNDWGQGLHDVFTQSFQDLGGQIVYDEGVTKDITDLRTQIGKIKKASPDVIYFPVYLSNGIPGARQMKELGLSVPVVGGDIFDASEMINAESADGMMYTVAVISNKKDFQEKVSNKTGKNADQITAPMAYDTIYIIADAITRAGTLESSAIRDEISRTSYRGVSSPLIEFDENGDIRGGTFQVRMIKGKTSEVIFEGQ